MQYPVLPNIDLPAGKKIYFASDFHLGLPNFEKSATREKLICQWLEDIKTDAYHIFLQGDLFDAWLEYKTVVPKGNVRFLAKLAQLSDAGIAITAFTGNHDLWMYGYFEQELNIPVYHTPVEININNKNFLLGHGDGLGPGDAGYKRLKKFLNNPLCQWLYRWIHPDIGFGIANYFSKKGLDKKDVDKTYMGDDKEYLVQFCQQYSTIKNIDYYIFGHRHLVIEKKITPSATYFNLGDWLSYNSYLCFDGNECIMKYYS